MTRERRKSVLWDCALKAIPGLLIFAVIWGLILVIFLLYSLEMEPFFYAMVFTGFIGVLYFAIRTSREYRRALVRERRCRSILTQWDEETELCTLADRDYHEMICKLGEEMRRITLEGEKERIDSVDYYTTWVHQIKTPIAVMKLHLNAEDTDENRALLGELFRIEQYVDMVLTYIRLGSTANDLVVREYELDEMVRESIRKYAPQFIQKRLKIEYEPTDVRLVTDRKWFLTIIEQLLSNAVKYTDEGKVRIAFSEGSLSISDTGIGIAADDLPRIFEKGYTGENGRIGKKSSGLGLYLAKKSADMLGIPMHAESSPGVGSCFTLDLKSKTNQSMTLG